MSDYHGAHRAPEPGEHVTVSTETKIPMIAFTQHVDPRGLVFDSVVTMLAKVLHEVATQGEWQPAETGWLLTLRLELPVTLIGAVAP